MVNLSDKSKQDLLDFKAWANELESNSNAHVLVKLTDSFPGRDDGLTMVFYADKAQELLKAIKAI